MTEVADLPATCCYETQAGHTLLAINPVIVSVNLVLFCTYTGSGTGNYMTSRQQRAWMMSSTLL